MKNFKDYLNDKEKEYGDLKNKIKMNEKKDVKGSLNISRRANNRVYYYHYIRDGKKPIKSYITKKNDRLVNQLAQKEYDNDIEVLVDQILKGIKFLNNIYEESLVDNCYQKFDDDIQKRIKPIRPTREQYAKFWKEQPYEKNTYKHNNTIYTRSGELVRSKSERLIADILYEKNIPYRYDSIIRLKNGVKFSPDFVVLTRDNREILLEHFGMIDKEDYAQNAVSKIEEYQRNGFIQGVNIIYTFETSTRALNSDTIYTIVNEFFI